MHKKILPLIALGILIPALAIAWTGPSQSPPNGNVAAPINTGSSAQTKSGDFAISGNMGVGTFTPGYKLDVLGNVKSTGSYYVDNWFRVNTSGNGIYWEPHGGGWYMSDSSWLRTYPNGGLTGIWANNGNIGTNGGLTVGYSGAGAIAGGAIFSNRVGVGLQNPGVQFDVYGTNTGNGQSNAGGVIVRVLDGLSRESVEIRGNIDGIGFADGVPAALNVRQVAGTGRSLNTAGSIVAGSTIWSYTLVQSAGNIIANGNLYAGGGAALWGANGDAYMPWAGNWLSTRLSDMRLKKNITDMPEADGLETIMKLRPITFEWRDMDRAAKDGVQIGFVAQEMKELFPQVINTSDIPLTVKTGAGEESVDKVLSIKYEALVSPIVKAIQQLKHLIDGNTEDIATLKAENAALRAELDALTVRVSAITQ